MNKFSYDIKLSNEEEKSIRKLIQATKNWPDSLWLFAANGSLNIMKKRNDERILDLNGCMSPKGIAANIRIEADGGEF